MNDRNARSSKHLHNAKAFCRQVEAEQAHFLLQVIATQLQLCRCRYNVLISFLAIFVIHGTFSYYTQPGWLPDLFFSINTKFIHKGKHGEVSYLQNCLNFK